MRDAARAWRSAPAEHWLTASWIVGLTRVAESFNLSEGDLPFRFTARAADAETWTAAAEVRWLEEPFTHDDGAAVVVGARPEAGGALIGALLGPEAAGEADGALREFINQAAATPAERATAEFGVKSDAGQCEPTAAPDDLGGAIEIVFTIDDVEHALLILPRPAFWIEEVSRRDSKPAANAPEDRKDDADDNAISSSNPPAADETALSDSARGNLRMLLDVELDLSVSFGHTELPLEDVLKLSSGSIVELNRSVNDPVDILVNGSVIARGEVVVVDGNYGIRVIEIASRQERMQKAF